MMSDEENKDDDGGLGFVDADDDGNKKSLEDSDGSEDEYDNQVSNSLFFSLFYSSNYQSQLINWRALCLKRTNSRCLAMQWPKLLSRDLMKSLKSYPSLTRNKLINLKSWHLQRESFSEVVWLQVVKKALCLKKLLWIHLNKSLRRLEESSE